MTGWPHGQHEIDHLEGTLYTDRMRPGVDRISVDQYRQDSSFVPVTSWA
ncbi:peptide deformylase [Streptomyces sp. NPDC057099]